MAARTLNNHSYPLANPPEDSYTISKNSGSFVLRAGNDTCGVHPSQGVLFVCLWCDVYNYDVARSVYADQLAMPRCMVGLLCGD